LRAVSESAAREKPGVASRPGEVKRAPKRRSPLTAEEFADGIVKGDRAALAKAITLVESSRASDREIAERVIEQCLSRTGNSIRVGITGVPGAGKSSLIEALGKHIVVDRGESVAVLAVDPTSRVSGGSILGDKTRMRFLAASDKAFIRPSPTRGAQGGVAQHTREAILLCEAAGFKNILVETVGVGQSEVAVRDMVDFFLLVAIAGAGDELQGIKRGVMELVDAVVVNKADGDNVRAAERARAEAENALHFLPVSGSGWTPRALACSAHTRYGVEELWSCVLEQNARTSANGWLDRQRLEQNRRWMQETLEEGLMHLFRSNAVVQGRMAELEQQVLAGRITAVRAARELLALYSAEPARGAPATKG
jgi:LAO/AO transport system kinase